MTCLYFIVFRDAENLLRKRTIFVIPDVLERGDGDAHTAVLFRLLHEYAGTPYLLVSLAKEIPGTSRFATSNKSKQKNQHTMLVLFILNF